MQINNKKYYGKNEIQQFNTCSIIYLKYNDVHLLLLFMIPLHEIVIKITQPANNYSYTAIISEAGKSYSTTSKLLGIIRISVSDYVRLNVSFNVLF